ncbi:MAG: MarC family protein [Bernardetiaceae bacterium]|jgi:multiple antibiotic resistance protein|nr:MarC family protein [Bernardetiaceae bacterium]
MNFDVKELITITFTLFAIIDILGSIPILVNLRRTAGHISSVKATGAAGLIMLVFLFLGEEVLQFIGLDVASFAVAGSLIIFVLGVEMTLGVHIFRGELEGGTSAIVPVAFPLVAGSGTLTTLLSLRANYQLVNILAGMVLNLVLVFLVIRNLRSIEHFLGDTGVSVLRKIFGVLLLAIAIKIFTKNIGVLLQVAS